VAVSQAFTIVADSRRYRRERSARWDADQKALAGKILAGALKLERDGWSVASLLDRDRREKRLPGATSLWSVPDMGIPGVIDEQTVAMLREAVHEAYQGLDELELHVETFVVVATPTAGGAARALVERLWDVFGALEGYANFDDAADEVERARSARDLFANEVRQALGMTGQTISDQRPRSD